MRLELAKLLTEAAAEIYEPCELKEQYKIGLGSTTVAIVIENERILHAIVFAAGAINERSSKKLFAWISDFRNFRIDHMGENIVVY